MLYGNRVNRSLTDLCPRAIGNTREFDALFIYNIYIYIIYIFIYNIYIIHCLLDKKCVAKYEKKVFPRNSGEFPREFGKKPNSRVFPVALGPKKCVYCIM